MYHTNTVSDVVAGLQEVFQQEQPLIKTPVTVLEPQEHVANAVHDTQHHLAAQLQQMHTMIQAVQLQYSDVPQPTYQDYGGRGNYVGHNNYRGQGRCGAQLQGTWLGVHGGFASSGLTHYCWTHVMCSHPVIDCRTPA